ncbi:MAG: acetylxylan esterase [Opitutus sp.]|nr:acetylxylan esterase [Opitutus sp.]
MFAEYFRAETVRVNAQSTAEMKTPRDWTDRRAEDREQLFEMLGLSPRPERTDLKPTITGREEHPEFFVEKLHFQSRPGLYVTANLYVPKNLVGRAPAILYGCGHTLVKEGAVSMGNKTGYQHHGAWFARHGYVCLVLDTIELGELEGRHHGTRRFGQYWWNSRGYTPAGVEAWNGIRALDYLQSRPEVDGEKIGMTGRSGGGAYTWYTAALDDRIKVAVPVAGITDLHNHVVDGIVQGHCDCMFMVNTYRWDYARLAALLAPRPLLLANSDKDAIFPLDGVLRVHGELARLYALQQASDKLGLLITSGPHKDTQDLQVPTFRWFNRWLKGTDPLVTVAAEKLFPPKQLRVFTPGREPPDERTTKIHDTFVPLAAPAIPADQAAWQRQRTEWMQALREKSFRGWPAVEEPLALGRRDRTGDSETWEFVSQGPIRLPLTVQRPAGRGPVHRVFLYVLDGGELTPGSPGAAAGTALVRFFPRGLGPTASGLSAANQNEVRRRYMLLGQTVDGMRVWDICRAVAALRMHPLFGDAPIHLVGARDQAINVLYASLFIAGLSSVELIAPPASHLTGPDYLNVLRYLDVPQTLAMAGERQPVKVSQADRDAWSWTTKTAQQLGWSADRLRFD